jgi:phage baseplate assembly protein gpV
MRLLTPLTAAALVVFSPLAFAAHPRNQASMSTKPATAPAATAKGAHMATMSGTIQKFDPATGTLTLKEGSQEVSFVLAPSAKVREGSKTLAAADLARAVGKHARVRYTGAGATRTAEQVIVSGGAMARKSPSPPSHH